MIFLRQDIQACSDLDTNLSFPYASSYHGKSYLYKLSKVFTTFRLPNII